MSYSKLEASKIFVDNILSRREFNILARSNKTHDVPFGLDEYENKSLILQNYQVFAETYINPKTPYNRVLLKYGTGTGKTLSSIAIASNFINIYKKEYELTGKSPNVFVIGFTGVNFQKEMLNFPELGFISRSEKNKLLELKILTETHGGIYKKNYNELYNRIRARITKKNKGGFYTFFGSFCISFYINVKSYSTNNNSYFQEKWNKSKTCP